MNAAIPSTTNARMMRQTSTIATTIPPDIVVMSIILNCFLKCGSPGTSNSQRSRGSLRAPRFALCFAHRRSLFGNL